MVLRADRLRAAREQRGLKQRELSEMCGMGETQINKYENGAGDPSATNLHAIATVLGVSTDYLLGLSDQPHEQSHLSLSPAEQRLLDAYATGDVATLLEMVLEHVRQRDQK